jgi:hypothetical protein
MIYGTNEYGPRILLERNERKQTGIYTIKAVANPEPRSGSFRPLDPGFGMGKIQIRDEHSGSYLRKWYKIFGLKIPTFFDADANPGSCQPWIRDGKKSDPV